MKISKLSNFVLKLSAIVSSNSHGGPCQTSIEQKQFGRIGIYKKKNNSFLYQMNSISIIQFRLIQIRLCIFKISHTHAHLLSLIYALTHITIFKYFYFKTLSHSLTVLFGPILPNVIHFKYAVFFKQGVFLIFLKNG